MEGVGFVRGFVVLGCLAMVAVCGGAPKRAAKPKVEEPNEFRIIVQANFARWDLNHDQLLDAAEINHWVSRRGTSQPEAAALVMLERHRPKKSEETANLSQPDLMAVAEKGGGVREYKKTLADIRAVNHALFLPGDPGLANFHQGAVGDCYLMSVIGSFVHRNPATLRAMLQVSANGEVAARFGNGRTISVAQPTDAEIVLNRRKDGEKHGMWLSALEKAYGTIRQDKKERETGVSLAGASTKELVGHGGLMGPVVEALTGHRSERGQISRWYKESPEKAMQELHGLLSRLEAEHRIAAMGSLGDKAVPIAKGIPRNHAFGFLGYDSARRMVRVFNPWGNEFMPSGTAGSVNGYVTHGGVCEIPVADLPHLFGAIAYETGKDLAK
ncbi:MAG: hypothetical protein JWM68_3283 [Verrucomicrobiales bacterium]|nr:hypothetical protein [Verrucomicrobiales bacterium]